MANDKVVGELIRDFLNKNIEIKNEAVTDAGGNSLDFKVSYYVSDENTKKYIEELGLDNPKKLAMFLVEVGFSAVEVVIGSINEIQVDIMNDHLSKLKAIKQKIKHNLLADDAKERLKSYQDELIDIRNIFEKRVAENIQRIIRIDKMSSFERKVKAVFIRNNVDTYTKSARICLQGVMEIAKIQTYIADYVGDTNFVMIQSDIDEFMNDILFNKNIIPLMNDWSTKNDRDFWNDDLKNDYLQIKEQHNELLELFTDIRNVAKEQKVGLENIIFE